MSHSLKCFLVLFFAFLFASATLAQFGRWRGNVGPIVTTEPKTMSGEGTWVDERTVRTAREVISHSTDMVQWTNEPGFDHDVFTFARVIYTFGQTASNPRISPTSSPWGWITDFPDSDLNLSFRVQQMTSIRTSPEGRTLRLTYPELVDYPWIYVVEPGRMVLDEQEASILRKYLLNGGFLMADDFWGQQQWDNFEWNIKRALPEFEFVELPMDHPVFHCVFDIKVPKNKLQTPNVGLGVESVTPGNPNFGISWEDRHGENSRDMHVRALFDDNGHMMIIATHNCDNGDGWEREGENDAFFHEYSEKRAFPLGINIIFYAMTH